MGSKSDFPKTLDVISPIYNASKFIERFIEAVTEVEILGFQRLNLILIDDGSSDDTLEKVRRIGSAHDSRWTISVLKLVRNMGQHVATKAGLQISTGDFIVLIDCDLEHDPSLIPFLTQEALAKQVDLVFVKFIDESASKMLSLKKLGSKLFSRIYKAWFSKNSNLAGISTFRLISRKVVNEALEDIELEDYSGIVTAEVTNNFSVLEFPTSIENNGSRYSIASRLNLFLRFIISRVPQFSIVIILLSSSLLLLTIAYSVFLTVDTLFWGGGLNPGVNQVVVLLCLILSSILFFGGLLLFASQYIVILLKRKNRITIESINIFDRNRAL